MSRRILWVVPAVCLMMPTRLSGQATAKPSFEQYLKESAVTRELIDRFLRGPSWAQFDPELGYRLGNYLPSDGIDGSATLSTSQSNGARTSFVYSGKNAVSTLTATVLRCATRSATPKPGRNIWRDTWASPSGTSGWVATESIRHIGEWFGKNALTTERSI